MYIFGVFFQRRIVFKIVHVFSVEEFGVLPSIKVWETMNNKKLNNSDTFQGSTFLLVT